MIMVKSNKFKLSYFAALSALLLTFAVAPANALPEQNINTVLKWVKTKPQLPSLEYGHETLTYYGTKGNLSFHVTVSEGIVIRESISLNGDFQTKFTNNNVKAIKFIQDIYGSNIANDFKNSRYVTKISYERFYRGKKFAYSIFELERTTDLPASLGLTIVPLNKLQEHIDSAKYCQTHECDI